MALKPKAAETEILILPISRGEVKFAVVGTSPFFFNRVVQKVKGGLLCGSTKKNAAEKASSMKHFPVEEYRSSVYRNVGDKPTTRLCVPAVMFKGAMMTAALDLPGTKRTEIGRLVRVPGETIDFYGTPQLRMDIVRSADINRTPDVRTRAIVSRWACVVTVEFTQPKLTTTSVANLLAAAGITSGIGDFRQEKGKGSFGLFRLTNTDDPEFVQIMKSGGRAAQDAALDKYTCYNDETAELMEFYSAEVIRLGRGKKDAA